MPKNDTSSDVMVVILYFPSGVVLHVSEILINIRKITAEGVSVIWVCDGVSLKPASN